MSFWSKISRKMRYEKCPNNVFRKVLFRETRVFIVEYVIDFQKKSERGEVFLT